MDIRDRLKSARKLAGISQLKLSEAIGCTRAAVTMWESGVTKKIDGVLLVRAAKELRVRPEWLAIGEEPMHIFDEEEFAMVPRYDVEASMGGGAEVDGELVIEHLAFKVKWLSECGLDRHHLALINAVGDSMEPTIVGGDILLVDKRQAAIKDLQAGVIYVLRIDTQLYAKRIQRKTDGSVAIMSDNKIYSEETVPADRLNDIHIIGRVAWIGRAF
jgi:phage repressor protein C with HTH and peptisase S24 domain